MEGWKSTLKAILRHRRFRSAATISLVLLFVICLALVWFARTPEQLADKHFSAMHREEGAQLDYHAAALGRLGKPGIECLVRAMESDRRDVVFAARTQLREQVIRWQQLDPAEGADRVMHLAQVLSARSMYLGPAERLFAGELATDLLLWPMPAEAPGKLDFVATCESILRHSLEIAPTDLDSPLTDEFATLRSNGSSDTNSSIQEPAPAERLSPLITELVVPNELPAVPAPSEESRIPVDIGDPNSIDPPLVDRSPSFPQPDAFPPIAATPNQVDPDLLDDVPRISHIGLMRYLHHPDRQFAEIVERELLKRGFTSQQIEISRDVTHRDAAIRSVALDTLRNTESFDTAPWLKVLAEDTDESIRGKALATLYASGNPNHRRFVETRLEIEQSASVLSRFPRR